MKKVLLKTRMLLAAALCAGTSAWADNVYTIVYGTPVYDDATITGVTPQTEFTSADGSTAQDVKSSDSNGNTAAMPVEGSVLYTNPAFTKGFETPATKGTVHFEANFTLATGNSGTDNSQTWKILDSKGVVIFGSTNAGQLGGNGNAAIGYCNGESLGEGWYRQARGTHNRVVLDINLLTKKVDYTILVSGGNGSYSTRTGTYDLPDAVSDVSCLSGSSKQYYAYMDYVSFYNVYDDAVSEYAYTINYQLDGETVATEAGTGEAGAVVNAVQSLWDSSNTQKYFVKDGETTMFIVAEGTNTFNVAVRKAEDWTYSIKAVVDGEELTTVATNHVTEGESASYGYPQYIAVDGKLYISARQSGNPWWGKSFTPTADNESQTIAYTAEGTENIVFCEEAENISTLTVVTGGNTDIRTSNRAGAYAASGEAVVATLPAGIYKMSGAVYGNAGTTFNFKAGNAIVLSIATDGNPKHTTSDEFIVPQETDITVSGGNSGNSPKIIDYIFIQKTADLPAKVTATPGLNGYTTFASAYNLDLSNLGDAKAYTATLEGTTLSFAACTATVPAGTGLLIESAEAVEIPVVTEAAKAVDGNVLTGVVKATDLRSDASGNYIFVMRKAKTAADELSFAPLSSENDVTVPAGKAYVSVAATAFASGSRALRVSFGGETTGIADTVGAAAFSDVVYNLNGQRMARPAQGIYIVNGKKVIIK